MTVYAEGTNTLVQGMVEERDWLARMSKFFTPEFWVSYNGTLYFEPKGNEKFQWVKEARSARKRYTILTNSFATPTCGGLYDLVAKGIADSGVEERWQKMVLVPRSSPVRTNSIFPKLNKTLSTIGEFKLLQSFENGDALIKDAESTFYVYGLGRAVDDKIYLNAELVKEELKTYTTVAGGTKTVEAYTSVSLNRKEKEMLSKISESFSGRVDELTKQIKSLAEQQKNQPEKK